MEVKVGYKQTEIGVIPEEWEVKRLGDIASISAGGTPSRTNPRYWDGDIPWVTTSEVDFHTINRAEQFITYEGLKNSAAKLLPPGTLLMALYGQGKTRGKTGILGIEAATNQACAAISLNRNVSSDFIFYSLASQYEAIRNLSNTGNQENLNGQIVRSIPVLLPPLPEQNAIAWALSDVDALLDGLDQLIAKKRDLKQAAMQQLFAGHTRLPGFHGPWDTVVLSSLLTMKATYGIVKAGGFKSSGVPMLRGGDIKDGRIGGDLPFVSKEKSEEYSRTILERDDVVIALVGYPGEAAKIPANLEGANISRAVGLLRLNNRITPNFLVAYLNSPGGRKVVLAPSAGSAQLVVNLAELNKLQLQLPTVDEQTAIAEVLSDMDVELWALGERKQKTRDIKQAMMQELLAGKTRLV